MSGKYFIRRKPLKVPRYELRGELHEGDPSKVVPCKDDVSDNVIDYIEESVYYDYEE